MAYLLRLAGHQVLVMGSMNYIEREMEGLRPDIALVGANNERSEISAFGHTYALGWVRLCTTARRVPGGSAPICG